MSLLGNKMSVRCMIRSGLGVLKRSFHSRASPPRQWAVTWRNTEISHRRFSSSSNSQGMEKSVLNHLSVIIDPDLSRDIVSLGFVKNLIINEITGEVKFDLELTTPACPVKDQFVSACEEVLKKNLSWVKNVKVSLTAQPRKSKEVVTGGLSRVSNIIAVSSCKGGVGKSTVAFNLALALRGNGAKIGILDADIFGPSLPVFAPEVIKGPLDETLPQQVQVFLHPPTGIKMMSMGYLKPNESVALRGPMVSGLIQQLLTSSGWGELDYLVVDMPPGTSDIHLTIGQFAPINGAVVVTTPHQLAIADVEKGIEFLNKMKVPTVGLVENFSFFTCNNCDAKHDIFGKSGSSNRVAEKFGIEHVVYLPIHPDPAVYSGLADTVVRELARMKFSAVKEHLEASEFDIVLSEINGEGTTVWTGSIPFRKLRMACRSANMIDEWTGEKLFKDDDIKIDVKPTKIDKAGNYAYRIDWSDGHHSIFPTKLIKQLIT